MIFIRTDILNPYNPKIVSQDNYSTLIKFLIKYFPSGFDRPVDISVNGVVIEVDGYDIALGEDDVIVLLDRSALPVGLIGGWFITALANLAISVTLSYVANKLFAPDEPEEQAKPSSVYTIATGQNTAKYGSPIPIVYGKVRMYPSMIVNPYYKIENNIEYLYHILCIGQGQYTTDSVMIGEDTITTAGDLQYKLMNKDTFYNIPANAYGIHITRTLSSPSNLELKEGVLTERYTIKQGTQTVEFDYHYPNGLYATNSSGEYIWGLGAFNYFIHSSTGTLLYTGRRQDAGISADPIQWTVSKYVGAWTVDDTITISFQQDVTVDDPGYSEKNYIKRVKEIYPNKDFTQLYGDITLLACKIKATNAVSSAGQVKVNGYFERTDVGNSMEEVLTDIYTNTNYGGALDVNDLDFPTTDAVVDCAYESNQTIFDAMRKPALAQGYSVFLAGMDVIMKKDGVNVVTSGMYNEQNILRDSLKVQYLFKEESPSYDGYEVSYIDGDGFVPATVTYPTNAIRPQKVDLFGVVEWHEPIEPDGICGCDFFGDGSTIGYWPLDGDLLDLCGSAHGTLIANSYFYETYPPSCVAEALFSTTADGLGGARFPIPALPQTISIAFWNYDYNPGHDTGLGFFFHFSSNDEDTFGAGIDQWTVTHDETFAYANNSYISTYPAVGIGYGAWHFYVYTSDGKVYKNGSLLVSGGWTVDMTTINRELVIMADRDPGDIFNEYLESAYSQLRLFNRSLTDEEVLSLYQASIGA